MLWHNTPARPHGHGCIFTVSIRVLRQWAQDIKGGLLARLRTHYPYPSRHNVQYVFSFVLGSRKFADRRRLCNAIEQLRVPFSALQRDIFWGLGMGLVHKGDSGMSRLWRTAGSDIEGSERDGEGHMHEKPFSKSESINDLSLLNG